MTKFVKMSYAEMKEKFLDCDKGSIEEEKMKKIINEREEWCIKHGYGKFKGITTDWEAARKKWGRFSSKLFDIGYDTRFNNEMYPWHTATLWVEDSWMIKDFNENNIDVERDGSPHSCKHCYKNLK